MKSFKQFLKERWLKSFQGFYQFNNKKTYDIFKNPSRSELAKLLKKSPYGSARVILHNNDAYVWDSDGAIHSDIRDELKLVVHPRNFIVVNADRYSCEYCGDGNISHLKNHPWVKRVLSDRRFFHS